MGTDKIRYIPTVIRWQEDGKVKEKILNVEDGISFKFEQSGHKTIKPKTYEFQGKAPVYNLEKEDAYNILGLSHAQENGYTNREGKDVYVLDSKDLERAKNGKLEDFASWIGSGGRFVKAGEIVSKDPNQNGGLNIIHAKTNQDGKREYYSISVFYNPPKK